MKPCTYLLLLIVIPQLLQAQRITGKITGEAHQPLSFSSVSIKGSGSGVSANAQGEYVIEVKPGKYTLVCQHVGYQKQEQVIEVGSGNHTVDFVLALQQYQLNQVTVKAGGEDPAYAIIRKAIKKRPDYENELRQFQCEVYIKGQLRLRDFPKKFLGQKVDFEDGDTSKKKILFLSESVSKYSVDKRASKVEVLSTRVSGSSDGYGFATPQIISFYHNNVMIGRNLNPRGFVSPIADNALQFYRYHFEGTYFEDNRMINRIKVISKRKYEPTFNGYINIIEDEWRIASLTLSVEKEQQMQLLDTLKIEQLYLPVNNQWILKQQVVYPAVKLLGFDAYGSFVQVHDKFNLSPVFPKRYFDDIVIEFKDSSNKKPLNYWDSIRPLPLQTDEALDYKKKDSLEKLRQDPHYLDSLDRKRNEVNPLSLLLTGKTFSKEKYKLMVTVPSMVNMVNYNTVEGANINLTPEFSKRFKDQGRSLDITPNLRYGFSNRHFNAHIVAAYRYGKKARQSFTFAGGKRVNQLNPLEPIDERINTFSSLLYERNYMKLYEAWFGRAAYRRDLGKGISITISAQYQDRQPLDNTTTYTWKDFKNRTFTPNYPENITNTNIPQHQALITSASLRWQPGAKYIKLPEATFNMGSALPTFNLQYQQGIYGILGSDVKYSRWNFSVDDAINLKLLGRLDYRVNMGGFLNNSKVFLPDYQHYMDNQTSIATTYMSGFQMMDYYSFSNTAGFQTSAHVEYHLNGLLSNKIPLLKKWNWFFIIGGNALHINNGKDYAEAFFSIDNILKVMRVDFIESFQTARKPTFGIRLSVPFIKNNRNNP